MVMDGIEVGETRKQPRPTPPFTLEHGPVPPIGASLTPTLERCIICHLFNSNAAPYPWFNACAAQPGGRGFRAYAEWLRGGGALTQGARRPHSVRLLDDPLQQFMAFDLMLRGALAASLVTVLVLAARVDEDADLT